MVRLTHRTFQRLAGAAQFVDGGEQGVLCIGALDEPMRGDDRGHALDALQQQRGIMSLLAAPLRQRPLETDGIDETRETHEKQDEADNTDRVGGGHDDHLLYTRQLLHTHGTRRSGTQPQPKIGQDFFDHGGAFLLAPGIGTHSVARKSAPANFKRQPER